MRVACDDGERRVLSASLLVPHVQSHGAHNARGTLLPQFRAGHAVAKPAVIMKV